MSSYLFIYSKTNVFQRRQNDTSRFCGPRLITRTEWTQSRWKSEETFPSRMNKHQNKREGSSSEACSAHAGYQPAQSPPGCWRLCVWLRHLLEPGSRRCEESNWWLQITNPRLEDTGKGCCGDPGPTLKLLKSCFVCSCEFFGPTLIFAGVSIIVGSWFRKRGRQSTGWQMAKSDALKNRPFYNTNSNKKAWLIGSCKSWNELHPCEALSICISQLTRLLSPEWQDGQYWPHLVPTVPLLVVYVAGNIQEKQNGGIGNEDAIASCKLLNEWTTVVSRAAEELSSRGVCMLCSRAAHG